MKRVTAAHAATAVAQVPFEHSFCVLASPWGYSVAEMETSLDDGALALYQSHEGQTLLRFASLDRANAVATVQVWGAGDVSGVRAALSRFEQQQCVYRTCSYLFPWEHDERRVLNALGFVLEATLRQHIWVRGGLQDLQVWGRLVESP